MQKAMTDLPTGSAARVLANEGVTRLAAIGVEGVLADADANRGKASFMDTVRFVAVAWYLSVVFTWLVLSRQIRLNLSVRRLLRKMAGIRVRTPVAMAAIGHHTGHCFIVPVSPRIDSDCDGLSRVQVSEDGEPLRAPHTRHDIIAAQGRGTYSHWDGQIYFSASDNTDPRTNGRKYTFKEI